MDDSVADVRGRQEHIPRQLALDSEVPRLLIGRLSSGDKLMKAVAAGVCNSRTKRKRRRTTNRIDIPFTPTGYRTAVSIRRQVAHKPLTVIVGHFVDAELIGAAIQCAQRNTPENHHLLVDLVGKSKAGTEVQP